MTGSRNAAIAASVIVLSILAIASNAGAVLVVNEMSGTFGAIDTSLGGPAYFELTDGVVSQTETDILTGLTIMPLGVDLTGFTNGGIVAIAGGTITVENPATSTSAVFTVNFATLTQVLSSPVGLGYMELDLSQFSNNLMYLGEAVTLPSSLQMLISYNGLVADDATGTASLTSIGSASFSAVPEPATLALLLGGFVLLRKFR